MTLDKKLLVVFNTCGINTQEQTVDRWIENIKEILSQDYDNYILAISGVMLQDDTKQTLTDMFRNHPKIVFNFIDEIVPVNVSFNHTVQKFISLLGEFDGYMYVASDIGLNGDKLVLKKLSDTHFNNNSGITQALVDCDHGIEWWFPELYDKDELSDKLLKYQELMTFVFDSGGVIDSKYFDKDGRLSSSYFSLLPDFFNDNHLVIGPGKGCNLHFGIFDKSIYDRYNKLMPDVFGRGCSESTFFYLCSSIEKKYIMHDNSILLTHPVPGNFVFDDNKKRHSTKDGTSIGMYYSYTPEYRCGFYCDLIERLCNGKAWKCGFGFEEVYPYVIFPHNSHCYDKNNNHIDPPSLQNFIENHLFLSQNEFSYDEIKNIQLI